MDTFSEKKRSEIMRKVKSQNTSPEVRLRSLLHARGYRYRLHRKDLPGSPDIVFPGKKVAIFVNGCFWHGHGCKRGQNMPKANAQYWKDKIDRNTTRDAKNYKSLQSFGWRCLIV